MKTLLVVGFLGLIIYNLGAGLYYMLTDKGSSKRTVNALTKRIVLSVVLILLVCAGISTGYIKPHGVGSNPSGALTTPPVHATTV
ncbi:twin transmembrane helix small protein [Lysobacter claricitrinus]|uniref:twin transmembrane helix small protein n=1 Tax=Lysobacter claricitrinus TaxID=3367728 RepID=UPI0037DAB1CA